MPNIAVVSSISKPTALEAGATIFIDSLNLNKSNALVEKLFAITSVTRPVSATSSPKPRKVDPAIVADSFKLSPEAVAKSSTPSVTLFISEAVNPSLENSTCKLPTSEALYSVDAPSSLDCSESKRISSVVAPEIAFNCAIV